MAYESPPDDLDHDLRLLRRIAAQDQHALSALYEHYAKSVFNMALYVLQNRSQAEEITQDVFVFVWQWPLKWNSEKGKFSSWLLAVTRYMAIDRLRRETSRANHHARPLEEFAERLGELSVTASPEDGLVLRGLIRQLPREQLETVFLSYYRGMTTAEIARHLQTPEGTVKSRLRLGLEKLRHLWHQAVNERTL